MKVIGWHTTPTGEKIPLFDAVDLVPLADMNDMHRERLNEKIRAALRAAECDSPISGDNEIGNQRGRQK